MNTYDESEDFRSILRDNGLQEEAGDDWEKYWKLESFDDTKYQLDTISTLVGRKTVTRLGNGAHETYDDSAGSAWIIEFKKDLLEGKFN